MSQACAHTEIKYNYMGRPDYILLEDTDLNQAKLWDDIVVNHIRKPHQGYGIKPNSDKGEFWLELNDKIQEKSKESYRQYFPICPPAVRDIPWVYFTEDEALHKAQIGRTRMIDEQTKRLQIEREKAWRNKTEPDSSPQYKFSYIDGPEPRILEYKGDYIKKPMPPPINGGFYQDPLRYKPPPMTFHGDEATILQKLRAWKENHTRLQSPQINHQSPGNMQNAERVDQRRESPPRQPVLQPQQRPAFRHASPRRMVQLQHRLRGVSPPRQAPPLQHQEWRAWV